MKTYLWKIDKEKQKKTNLALYSNFIKKKYKINSGNNLIKFGSGLSITHRFSGNQFGILQK